MMTPINTAKNKGLPKESHTFVMSFARGLAVIRAFDGSSRALTISEVAERVSMAPATARRLLHTLVSLGYARLENNRFELTPRILELGFTYLSTLSLRDIAQPVIDSFVRETAQACSVSVLDHKDVVYIVRSNIRSPLVRNISIGERLPAHATSSGHVLLSGLSKEELESFLQEAPFTKFTESTRYKREDLVSVINDVFKKGWALATEELELGVCGLAVPIYNENGIIIAALTISVNLAKHTAIEIEQLYLDRLIQAAEQISRGRKHAMRIS